uniref:DNA-directed RNA polymerase I subunit RPA34 n=2 Tax=Candida glabrata TaxID=5478 RepID=UPI0001E15E32
MGMGYQPPSDYKQCKHLKSFPVSELKGDNKELWLMKVPANIDISQLKSLPLDTDATVSTVELGSKNFNVLQNTSTQEGSDNTNLSLLIPSEKKKETLKVATSKDNKSVYFDRVFTISETARIP